MAKSNKKYVFNINELIDDDTIYGFTSFTNVFGDLTKKNIQVLNGKRIKDIIKDFEFLNYFRLAKIKKDGFFDNFVTYRMRNNGYVTKGKEYDTRVEYLIREVKEYDGTCCISLMFNQIALFYNWYNDDKTNVDGLGDCWHYIEYVFNNVNAIFDCEEHLKGDSWYTKERIDENFQKGYEWVENNLLMCNNCTQACKDAYFAFKDRINKKYNLNY